jgi:mono/diheme cytochrome c family protein
MSRFSLFAAAALLACTAAASAHAQTASAQYTSKCAICHGADGKGSAVGAKLGVRDFQSPEVVKESDEQLYEIIKNGKNKMPAYNGKLTDDQIKDLVRYVRSLK